MEMRGSRTEQNLMKAFAGESQARNRYTFFAKVAEEEGYIQIAKIFLETADNERSHGFNFFSLLDGGMPEFTWAPTRPVPWAIPPGISEKRPMASCWSGARCIRTSPR